MIADYLAAEDAIRQRLEAEVTAARAVLASAELASMQERGQITPALHVIYGGDTVPTGPGQVDDGRYHVIHQRWLVIVAVRSARGQQTGTGARDEAGPLMTAVMQALAGWRPLPELGTLRRASAPGPAYSPGGYAYFPTAWDVPLIMETTT